jgi:hypothetical protein
MRQDVQVMNSSLMLGRQGKQHWELVMAKSNNSMGKYVVAKWLLKLKEDFANFLSSQFNHIVALC